MSFEVAVQMLKNFHYGISGKESTIEFLKFIVQKLEENDE